MRGLVLGLLSLWALGCGETDDPCSGPQIDPFPIELAFGDIKLEGEASRPERRVALFRNRCGAALQITEVCIIEDDHNGDANDPVFELEPADRVSIPAGEDGAVRVTYAPTTVNEDLDQDAIRDLDQAVLVIQSNAADHPTLVIPLCGRLIADNEEADDQPCGVPFSIPTGERIAELCAR